MWLHAYNAKEPHVKRISLFEVENNFVCAEKFNITEKDVQYTEMLSPRAWM